MKNYNRKQSFKRGEKKYQPSFDEALIALGFNLSFSRGKAINRANIQKVNYTGSVNK